MHASSSTHSDTIIQHIKQLVSVVCYCMDGDIVIKAVHFQEVCCQPCVDLVDGYSDISLYVHAYVGLGISRGEANFDEIVEFN